MKYFTNIKNNLRKIDRWFIALFTIALCTRVWGITWGFPEIYHPDEPTIVRDAIGVAQHNLSIKHFDWPHLQTYISSVVFTVFIKFRGLLRLIGLDTFTASIVPLLWDDPLVFYFITRFLTAVMGALTVGFVYLIGKKIHSRGAGLLAGALLLLNVAHIAASRLATIDAPMVFWITLSLLFSISVVETGRLRSYLLAGFTAGFAASTKYNGAFAVVTIITAFALYITTHRDQLFRQFRYFVIAGVASLLGFFAGTPNALWEWQIFTSNDTPAGAFWQFTREGNSGSLTYLQKLSKRFFSVLPAAQSILVSVVMVLSFLFAFVSRRWKYVLLSVFPFAYLMYVGGLGYFQAHFFLPVYPYVALLVGLAVMDFSTWLKSQVSGQWQQLVPILLFSLILFFPLRLALHDLIIISRPDTREIAVDWLDQNIPDDSYVALGQDYEPILPEREAPLSIDPRPDYYYLTSFSSFDERLGFGKSLMNALKEEGITHIVLGGFNLGDDYDAAVWSEKSPSRLGWLKKHTVLIYRLDPIRNPGPTVLVFEMPTD